MRGMSIKPRVELYMKESCALDVLASARRECKGGVDVGVCVEVCLITRERWSFSRVLLER